MTRQPQRRAGVPRRAKVLLTHSRGALEDLGPLLARNGFEVVHEPLINIVPRTDAATRANARELLELPWLLFTSRNTVAAWLALGLDLAAPRIGVIGDGTRRAVEGAGGTARLLARPSDARGLVQMFLAHPEAAGPVGLPRGNRALTTVEQGLSAASFECRPLVVYDTATNGSGAGGGRGRAMAGSIASWAVDAIVLASPSAVEALPSGPLGSVRLIAIGGTTAAAIGARGWHCQQSSEPDAAHLLAALERSL